MCDINNRGVLHYKANNSNKMDVTHSDTNSRDAGCHETDAPEEILASGEKRRAGVRSKPVEISCIRSDIWYGDAGSTGKKVRAIYS